MSNNFLVDEHCYGDWTMDEDAVLAGYVEDADIINNQLMSNNGDLDQANQKEGDGCCDFDGILEGGSLSDSSVVAGFPLKGGDTIKIISVAFWFRSTSFPSEGTSRILVMKYAYWAGRTFVIYLKKTGGNTYVAFGIGYGAGGGSWELVQHLSALTVGRWYHVGVTFQDSDGTYRIRIWDDTAGAILGTDLTGNMTNKIYISSAEYYRVATNGSGEMFSGKMDEVVFFNDILTTDEIDKIRQGLYPSAPPASPAIFFSQDGVESTLQYRLFPYPPTWPVTELLEWKTNIIRPKDTSREQRIALRIIPRQGFRYKAIMGNNQERAALETLLYYNLKRKWGVPVWTEAVQYDAAIASGATTISIDTRYADFRDNSYAVIWKSPIEAEVVHVATKTDNALNLSETVVAAYAAGVKFIIPMRFGYVTGPVKRSRRVHDSEFDTIEIAFGLTDNVGVSGFTAEQTYDGLTLLLDGHMAYDDLTDDINHDMQLLDSDTGTLALEGYSDFNVTAQPHTFQNMTKTGAWAFRQWLHSIYGRQKAFLVPTRMPDLQTSRIVLAADEDVYVDYVDLVGRMGLNDLRTYIAFTDSDGSLIPRKITAVAAVDADEEMFTMDADLDKQFAAGTDVMFVDKCRLGRDSIEIEWFERERNRCRLDFVRVQE